MPLVGKTDSVVLDGCGLEIEDIVLIGIGDKKVELSGGAMERARASRAFLEKEVSRNRIIYGVNTSFGPMCGKIIHANEIGNLQVNLIRSHAAGLGEPLKPYISRAVMAVRLNALVKGYSGVSVELIERLRDLVNLGVAAYIPECGSVGASGDLVHLAHMALAVIGEGKVFFHEKDGSWSLHENCAELYAKLGLSALRLSYKDGIGLMNGTAAMSALGAFAMFGAEKLFRVACANAAFAMEIFGGIDDAFDEDLHAVKPHPGQVEASRIIRQLYRASENIIRRDEVHKMLDSVPSNGEPVYETSINVQDVYSIRCTPQILSPVREALDYARRVVHTEVNSSNDNPVVIPEKSKIIHGGNFHGQSVAFAMDSLCMAIAELCNLSERRINKMLDKNLNEGLPEHLIPDMAGLKMGFMGAQYLATSTTAENRQLANPVGTLSISCNSSNQDVVSMGTVAARKAFKSVSNAKHVLTLETLADLQSLSFRNSQGLGSGTRKIYDILIKEFKPYDNERIFHDDLVKFRRILFSSQLFDSLEPYFN